MYRRAPDKRRRFRVVGQFEYSGYLLQARNCSCRCHEVIYEAAFEVKRF